MQIFLLIIRILLLIAFVVGIILMAISNAVAESKKFKKDEAKRHYATKFKLIGFLVCAISFLILLIMSLF